MDTRDPEIQSLVQQAQFQSETVQELAFDCLQQFRKECRTIVERYRMDGEERIATPNETLRQECDQRVQRAREQLKERLRKLLQTAQRKGF